MLCPAMLMAQVEVEPNNSLAQANALTLGTAMNGDIGGAPCGSGTSDDYFSVNLTQSGRTLTGTLCNDNGYLDNVTLTLSGSSNTSFSGTSTSCNSINNDCQAPFGSDCGSSTVQGSISGSTFSGTYDNGEGGCSSSGTFTGTIS